VKFYTGRFGYHELNYDKKNELEDACRQKNEKEWGETFTGCYMAVSEVQYAHLSIVCAVREIKAEEKEIRRKVADLIAGLRESSGFDDVDGNGDNICLREVTLNTFLRALRDTRLIADMDACLDTIGLFLDKKCFREQLLGTEYWDKKNSFFDKGLLDEEEKKRIRRGKRISQPLMPPVHYVVYEEEADTIRAMVQELLSHLCRKGRLLNRRLVKLDSSDVWDIEREKVIQNLNCLDGGCVVVYIRENDTWSSISKLLSSVYIAEKPCTEKYIAIIVLPSKMKKEQILRKYMPGWAFIELYSRRLTVDEAKGFFSELIVQDGLKPEQSGWEDLFEGKEQFSQGEVVSLYKNWKRYGYHIHQYFPQYEDVIRNYFHQDALEPDAREELHKMVGLTEVKLLIDNIISFYKLQSMRIKKGGIIRKPTMHMVFYGNPGTAKTTVARLVGRILKEEKVLSKGDFYEVGRADMVGKYVGWTARTVQEYFQRAEGSVLFIDEAYALADDQKSFGDEAISAIVREMENHRNDVVVIMAGYKKSMEKLLQRNQGMRSRIAFYVDFPDYSIDELYSILEMMAAEEGLHLAENVWDPFCDRVMQVDIHQGNGRAVRNILDGAKLKQAVRVLNLPEEEQGEEMYCLREADFI